MVSPRQPSKPAAAAGSRHPHHNGNARTHDAEDGRAVPRFDAIWAASRDAIRHGAIVARIGARELQVRSRRQIAAIVATAMGVVVAAAVLVTLAVWATVSTLTEFSAALGGGLAGCLGAIVVVATAIAAIGAAVRIVGDRRRAARLRREFAPRRSADMPAPSAELAELRRIRDRALAELRGDKERLEQHGRELVERRPLVALGVSAGSGLLVSRLLMALPRNVRRGAIGAVRALRSAGLAAVVGAFSDPGVDVDR